MRKQECKTIGTQRNCHSFEMRFRLKNFTKCTQIENIIYFVIIIVQYTKDQMYRVVEG